MGDRARSTSSAYSPNPLPYARKRVLRSPGNDDLLHGILPAFRLIDNAEHQHREDGPHAAQRHQAEAH